MSEPSAEVERVLQRLSSGPLLEAGVDLAIQAALDRPLAEAVDAGRAVALVVGIVDEPRLARALSTVVHPALDRQRQRLAAGDPPLGAFLPEGAAALLEEIAEGTRPPRGGWVRRLVDPADVRELLAPVLQETLLAFARKLPLVSGVEEGKAGKLLGGLARGLAQGAGERAQKLADLGRGVLGGLGAEMEKRVVSAAREYSQGAVEPLRDAFAERLASDDGRAILRRMRAHAVEVLLATPASELASDLEGAARAPLDRLVARTVAHDLARPDVQRMLREEVEAFLAERAGRTVREALDEWGATDAAVAEARIALVRAARATVASPAFEAWLAELLA